MRIIHLLGWRIQDIEKNISRIHDQGFDNIQINPIQPLKESGYKEWWISYQPCDFSIGNDFGSKKELDSLCNTADKYGIKIIADVIYNHMAGKNDGSLYPNELVAPYLRENPYIWKEAKQITNWSDRNEVINYCMGLPGLNPNNHDLQNIIVKFLNELIDTGVLGFRFDAAKNMALPSEGCDFWPRVIYLLKKYGLNIYGEIIFVDDKLLEEYSKYMKIVTNHDYYNKDSIIKYIESHDSYYNLKYTSHLSSHEISSLYPELCRTYPNTLYFTRPYDNTWMSDNIGNGNHNNIYTRKLVR